MIVTELRTDDVPAAERFDYWCDSTASALASVLLSEHAADFRATLRMLTFGGLQIYALRYPSVETRRSAQMVRDSDPENYHLMLNLQGSTRVRQGGRETTICPGELTLGDTSRPWHGWSHADAGVIENILVQVPMKMVPLPADTVRQLTTLRLPAREGVGALLAGYLTQLTTTAKTLTAADGPRLASITIDLLTTLCTHYLDTQSAAPPESGTYALFLRVRNFIEQRLDDPDLTPGMVAASCQVSTRHLHRLFQDHGLTVAGHIRRCRLERCRRDLADPDQRHRPIHAIAARWGFADPAHFSRTFRAAFGMPPIDYRHQTQYDLRERVPAQH